MHTSVTVWPMVHTPLLWSLLTKACCNRSNMAGANSFNVLMVLLDVGNKEAMAVDWMPTA